ncbi:bifunctional diguanylate cyclase/phosphodiesterase [Segnochrobactrum spirostomi]|uniref:EAL domain-containing protein n=1 Tax=Segnochrobactrum spirostomi TaxID=2608987 RepID=A0A6A7Y8U8_9HYPH|nr:EAL domain-containing protein [Segnochrobactrum spirostomi]MQT14072.1 EAL domain-containing protein [Segnochrobactrum spirostomi]
MSERQVQETLPTLADAPARLRPPFLGTIASRFVLFVFCLTFIPLFILGATSYNASRKVILSLTAQFSETILSNERDYLDLQFEQVENLLNTIASLDELRPSLTDPKVVSDDFTRLATQEQIGAILNAYLYLRGIASIDVIGANGSYYHIGETVAAPPLSPERRKALFERFSGTGTDVVWFGIGTPPLGRQDDLRAISAGRAIQAIDRRNVARDISGVAIVNYSVAFLYDHLVASTLPNDAYLLIADADGNLVFDPDRDRLGKPVPKAIAATLGATAWPQQLDLGDEPVLLDRAVSAVTGWSLLSVTPADAIAALTRPIGLMTLVLIGLCIALLCIASYVALANIVRPLRAITARFRQFQSGGFREDILPLRATGDGEVADLTRWFNTFLASERKRRTSEEALIESEERYALAARGANDALWDWDLRANRVYYSPRWKALVGGREQDIGDRPASWIDRIHPDEREDVLARISAHVAGKTSHLEVEHRLRRADGSYIWVLVRAVAVRDAAGIGYRMAGSHADITAHKRAEEQLRHDAMHDMVTGLPNRRAIFRTISQAIASANRRDRLSGLIIADIDQFKDINDTLGHEAGDSLLMAVADRIRRTVRDDGDVVARLGGDEFAIFCPNLTAPSELGRMAERILSGVSEPIENRSERYLITMSAGLAVSRRHSGADDLIREADLALFEAKRQGRNRMAFFNEVLENEARERLAVETALRSTPAADSVFVLFQPQVAAANGEVEGFEALARWRRRDGSVILPTQFIPAAERTGIIRDITRVVIARAVSALEAFAATGARAYTVAVNLSTSDLEHVDFASEVEAILAGHGLDPRCIGFEITEGALLRSSPVVLGNMRRLADIGCRFALDDFGTGFSSLSYLWQFPISVLKIDKSFVQGIGVSLESETLTRAVIGLGRAMTKTVIAEGVETTAQAEFLRTAGCDTFQGFLYAKPMEIDAVAAYLRDKATVAAPLRPQVVPIRGGR